MPSKQKILITGITGLAGQFIARKFLSEGYSVKGLVNTTQPEDIFPDLHAQIEWKKGDVTDITSLENAIEKDDWVIHGAAIVSFHKRDRDIMQKINVEGTRNIVNLCLELNVERFCQISSIASIGREPGKKVVSEDTKTDLKTLTSFYAKTKYESELEVWRGIEEGLSASIVNPSVILGPGDWNRSSTVLFKRAYENGQFYTDGLLNYVDVRDVANVIFQLMTTNITSERFILDGGHVTYKEAFEKMTDAFDRPGPKHKVSYPMAKALYYLSQTGYLLTGKKPALTAETIKMLKRDYYFNNEKVKRKLNYTFHSFNDTIDWSCKNLRKKYSL